MTPRQAVGLAVEQGGNNHRHQRCDNRPGQALRFNGQATDNDAADNTGKNRPGQRRHLFILQADILQPADNAGVLLCQHNTDEHHNQPETQNTAAG